MKSERKAFWILVCFFAVLIGGVVWATNSTETAVSLSTGLKIGGAAADRIGFYDATPTPKPLSNNLAPTNATPLPTPAGTPSQTGVTNMVIQTNANTVLLNQIQASLAAEGLIGTPTPTPTASATFTPTPTPTP